MVGPVDVRYARERSRPREDQEKPLKGLPWGQRYPERHKDFPHKCRYCGDGVARTQDIILKRRIARRLDVPVSMLEKIYACQECLDLLLYHKRDNVVQGREFLIRHYERVERAALMKKIGPKGQKRLKAIRGNKGQLKRGYRLEDVD